MGPKKGRRVKKKEVPTDSALEFELGDSSRYSTEERGEGGMGKGGKDKETKGGRGQEGGNYTLSRESGVAEKGQGQTKVIQKQRLEETWKHHSHDTRRGT